jgi:hypothetical protein
MPLSAPAARKLMHTRTIQCCGYRREDGLWDIEAHMQDIKSFSFPNQDRGGEIKAGEPLHGMWLRVTLDMDFVIHAIEACTDWSPFNVCPEIVANYKRLIGLRIGPGWNRKLKTLVGRTEGCTHLTELLGPIATTAFQTMHPNRKGERKPKPGDPEKPRILNSCHALSADGDVVRQHWPAFYTGPDKDKKVVSE